MADHRDAVDVGKGLAGEAAGAHAGGDNGDDIHEASPERCRLVGFVHHQISAELLEVRVQFLTLSTPCPSSVDRCGVILRPTLGMKAYGVIW